MLGVGLQNDEQMLCCASRPACPQWSPADGQNDLAWPDNGAGMDRVSLQCKTGKACILHVVQHTTYTVTAMSIGSVIFSLRGYFGSCLVLHRGTLNGCGRGHGVLAGK